MAHWKHHPGGIKHALANTLHDAEGFADAVRPLDGEVAVAIAGTGPCPPIVAAMNTFIAAQQEHLTGITQKVTSCLNGAQKATGIYLTADKQMADNHRSADSGHR
jgi:hypothetical protein